MVIVLSFEGLPLVGKTSLASVIYEYYKIKGYDVMKFDETYSSELGIVAKKYIFQNRSEHLSISFLLASCILQAYENLIKKIISFDIVIIDNFYSTYLIYCILNNVNLAFLDQFLLNLTIPNIIFYVTSNYEIVKKRKKEKHIFDQILESKDFFDKANKELKSRFIKYAQRKVITVENNTYEIFDTFKNIKEVLDQIVRKL